MALTRHISTKLSTHEAVASVAAGWLSFCCPCCSLTQKSEVRYCTWLQIWWYTYLLLRCRLHLEVIHVQTALGLLSPVRPPSRTFARVAIAALNGAVPVTNAAVALVEQLVPRDVVFFDVPFNEVKVPCEQRVELQETSAVYLKRLEIRAIASLRSTAASNNCLHTEFFVCTPSWLNLI